MTTTTLSFVAVNHRAMRAELVDGPGYTVEYHTARRSWVTEAVIDGEPFPIGEDPDRAVAAGLALSHAQWFRARQVRRTARA